MASQQGPQAPTSTDIEAQNLIQDAREPKDDDLKEGKVSTWECLVTGAFCIGFLCVGPVLILANRHIMKDVGFDFPIFVSGIGQVASAVGAYVVTRQMQWYPLEKQDVVTRAFFINNMLPVAACSAATLIFGNYVYLHLSVSLIQMLKAFTPVITLAMLAALSIEYPTTKIVFCVVMITVGTCLTTTGEVNFSFIGMIHMLFAMITEGIKLVFSQKLLSNHKFHAFEALYNFAPATAAIMFLCSVILEFPRLLASGKYVLIFENLPLFLLAGVSGFFVNIATFFVIKRTNAVMIKVMSTARNAGLVFISVLFYGEIVTSTQGLGYLCCLVFFGLYNYYKMNKL